MFLNVYVYIICFKPFQDRLDYFDVSDYKILKDSALWISKQLNIAFSLNYDEIFQYVCKKYCICFIGFSNYDVHIYWFWLRCKPINISSTSR